jgi:hypothetical protein
MAKGKLMHFNTTAKACKYPPATEIDQSINGELKSMKSRAEKWDNEWYAWPCSSACLSLVTGKIVSTHQKIRLGKAMWSNRDEGLTLGTNALPQTKQPVIGMALVLTVSHCPISVKSWCVQSTSRVMATLTKQSNTTQCAGMPGRGCAPGAPRTR